MNRLAKLRRQESRSYRIGHIFDRTYELACRKFPEESCLSPTRFQLGNIFLLEIRNFLGRIELLYAKFLWSGVSLGPCYQRVSSGCLVLNTRTGENIDYTEQLRANFPWATSVDYQMLVETRNSQERNKSELGDSDPLGTPAQTHSLNCSCQFTSSLAPQSPTPSPSLPLPSQA